MKGTKTLFSSKSDEWETPKELYKKLDEEFKFNLDPCASKNNAKCTKYFTKENNGLKQSWGGIMCFVTRHMARK